MLPDILPLLRLHSSFEDFYIVLMALLCSWSFCPVLLDQWYVFEQAATHFVLCGFVFVVVCSDQLWLLLTQSVFHTTVCLC